MTKRTEMIFMVLYALSALTVLVGAFIKIMHYSNNYFVLFVGLGVGSLISAYESAALRKELKQLREQLNQK